jgi:hypothetical protein
MTDQELLQQAKDQVAKEWILENMGYTYTGENPWELIVMKYYDGDVPPSYTDEAALLAIQSAREESKLKYFNAGANYGYQSGQYDASSGHDRRKISGQLNQNSENIDKIIEP